MFPPIFCNFGGENNYQNNNGNLVRDFFINDVGPYTPILRFLPYNPYSCYQSVPDSINLAYRSESKNNNYTDREITLIPKEKTTTSTKNVPSHSIQQKTVTNPQKSTPQKTTHTSQNQTKSSVSQKELASSFIQTALKYFNCNEKNGTHHMFCVNPSCKAEDPYDQEWCTDFVTYVVKESYRNYGKKAPAGFGEHDVERMKKWAIRNDCFIRTSNIGQKGRFIAQNIKKGDIIVLNENNSSHIGFVTNVDDNGIIRTIEGNRDDKVSRYSYSPDNSDISGFIRLQP